MTQMKTRFGKVSLALTSLALMGAAAGTHAQGTIYVEQVGQTGSTAVLTSGATPLFLDQFKTDGTANGTSLDLTTAGGNALYDSGTATSEGQLTQAGNYLTFVGYDTTSSATGVASSSAPRGIGVYNIATGTVDSSTALTDAYLANNIRSAVTSDGKNIYTAGTGTAASGSGGVRYAADGASTSTSLEANSINTRVVEEYNGNLYFSTSTATANTAPNNTLGIYEVATGLPTTTGQAITPIAINGATAVLSSPYGFTFANGGNTLYVADSANGLVKFTLSGGTFTYQYTDPLVGLSSIAFGGTDTSGNNILYGVTGANSHTTGTSALFSLDDTGTNGSFALLDTAPTNTAFTGVAFVAAAPEPSGVAGMLIGAGVLGLIVARRRKAAQAS